MSMNARFVVESKFLPPPTTPLIADTATAAAQLGTLGETEFIRNVGRCSAEKACISSARPTSCTVFLRVVMGRLSVVHVDTQIPFYLDGFPMHANNQVAPDHRAMLLDTLLFFRA